MIFEEEKGKKREIFACPRTFASYCMYSTFGESKSVIVERFNRTMKMYMFKYFTANNTRKYIDVLPQLFEYYNNKHHRSIKMTPNEASQPANHIKVYENLYDEYFKNARQLKKIKPKLKVGDYVRISFLKGVFDKGYHPNWTRQLYKVSAVHNTTPVTYSITEYDDTPIVGKFYEQELQKTNNPEFFEVEKVLKHDKKKKRSFVKFLGWEDKYNAWVDDKNMKDV
jgi:hypothetical protein